MLWAEHVARNTAAARDDVFAEVRQQFNDAELVELTGVCGLFALSNRFQDSMQLPIEEQHEVDKIRASVRADPEKLKAYLQQLIAAWPADYPRPEAGAEPVRIAVPAGGPAAARVPLVDAESAQGDARLFLDSAHALLGGDSNLLRVWANVPHVGKFVAPLQVALARDGGGGTLPAGLKALAQLRTAAVHASPYVLAHATALAQAAGVAADKIAAASALDHAAAGALDARESAVVAWAAGVARNTARSDEPAFAALKQHCDDAEVVELTALCAFTNMIALFANALAIPVEPRSALVMLYRSSAVDHNAIKAYLERLVAAWPAHFPEFR